MPRFTVKDILIATTLVAIGLSAWVLLYHNWSVFQGGQETRVAVTNFCLWFGGGACIGAGMLTPFKRPWAGATAAVMAQALFMALCAFG